MSHRQKHYLASQTCAVEQLTNDIALRPRFRWRLAQPKELVLDQIEGTQNCPFILKRVDDHIFLRFPTTSSDFWTPQLHIEIIEAQEGCTLHGLYGPNPTLWTFFMFLHFGIALLFVGLGIWTYSLDALEKSYTLPIIGMIFLSLLWVGLYGLGRYGRVQGRPQMEQLHLFLKSELKRIP